MQDLDLIALNEWLDGFSNFEKKPNNRMLKLETMKILCEKFSHPEKACPCFHVAGSKGKGTIAADIAGILREAGYKTGVYMSPHVSHFTERVSTGAEPFSAEVYDAAFTELRSGVAELIKDKVLKKKVLTWYELVTMFAMLCFREAKVDYAIYEVGMGGRLDATNIVEPVACAFGLIELEHTEFLGDTLAEIAGEKAGIIKQGVPCVSVPQEEEAAEVLKKVADEHGAEIEFVPDEGNYVAQDAEVARRTVLKVLPKISEKDMRRGIRKVALPGRFEKITDVPDVPLVLLDGAHTPSSIAAVLDRMRAENIKHGVLVFGCAKDKKVEEMADLLVSSGLFEGIFLTEPGDFKKCDFPRMVEAFSDANVKFGMPLGDLAPFPNYRLLLSSTLNICANNGLPMVVLGSFYLVGEARKMLRVYGY